MVSRAFKSQCRLTAIFINGICLWPTNINGQVNLNNGIGLNDLFQTNGLHAVSEPSVRQFDVVRLNTFHRVFSLERNGVAIDADIRSTLLST